MRIVAVTQARTGSTRLPGKILKKIGDSTLLELHVKRVLKSKKIDQLILATTVNPEDAAIVAIANRCEISSSRGSESDVLDRYFQSVQGQRPDYVVRLTSDCPLIDAELIDKVIDHAIAKGLDYCSNTLDPTYPDGEDVEVFTFAALERAWREAKLQSEREHVTPFIWKNSSYKGGSLFKSENFDEGYHYGHLRLTVDEQKDFDLIEKLVENLGPDSSWLVYAKFLESNKDVQQLNESISRNEGYQKTIDKEKL